MSERKKKKQKSSSKPFSMNSPASTPGKRSGRDSTGKAAWRGTNSVEESTKFFEWLISPVQTSTFYRDHWEKKHCVISRDNSTYYTGWFTKGDIDLMLKEHPLRYGTNIDITKYIDGQRKTLNPDGFGHVSTVKDFYTQGCSIRLLNPQAFNDSIWKMLSSLQEHFGCFVGANIYLTPAGSQGFAPHYDDVDVFIIQLEGEKHWRLYDSINENDRLARTPSPNFAQEDIGNPIEEVTLKAGDCMYFPRGTIHQAVATNKHSLHLTISSYQNNSWGDFMERVVPRALDLASEENIEFRKGLPHDFLSFMGVANVDEDGEQNDPRRKAFIAHAQKLFGILMEYMPLDAAADQMGIKYQHDALPPVLAPHEASHTVTGEVAQLTVNSLIRLIRASACRVVPEPEMIAVYFHTENSRVYHQLPEPEVIEFSSDSGPALEYILEAYKEGFVPVSSIPADTDEQKLDIANALYERGILRTKD